MVEKLEKLFLLFFKITLIKCPIKLLIPNSLIKAVSIN